MLRKVQVREGTCECSARQERSATQARERGSAHVVVLGPFGLCVVIVNYAGRAGVALAAFCSGAGAGAALVASLVLSGGGRLGAAGGHRRGGLALAARGGAAGRRRVYGCFGSGCGELLVAEAVVLSRSYTVAKGFASRASSCNG